jgi:hypothetical protein
MNRQSLQGGWVEYREPENVPERLRREVTKLSTKGAKFSTLAETDPAEMNEDELESMTDFMSAFNDSVALALVSAWSFDAPVTKDGLLDLPASAYDEIVKHCTPLVSRLMPNFGVDTDPKAPTDI